MILFTAMQNGKLLWLFHENGKFFRENRQAINNGEVNPLMRFRIQGERTLIGLKNTLVVFAPQKKPETLTIDAVGNMAVFDANEETYFFLKAARYLGSAIGGRNFLVMYCSGVLIFGLEKISGLAGTIRKKLEQYFYLMPCALA